MEKKQCVTLSADIMFINGIPFFFTDGHYINFITVLITKDQQNQGPLCKAQLLHQVNVDGQKIWTSPWFTETLNIGLGTVSKLKHVADIEKLNLIIKEKVQATKHCGKDGRTSILQKRAHQGAFVQPF